MRLDERVAARTRIARDLHDTLLQSFQALLLRFQAGINMLGQRPADARRLLEDAFDRAWHAIAEGRDAIGELRMSTVEKNDLAVALKTIGKELATAQGNEALTSFQLLVEGTPRELHRGTKSTASRRGAAQCLPACGSKKRGSRNPLRQKVFPASHSR